MTTSSHTDCMNPCTMSFYVSFSDLLILHSPFTYVPLTPLPPPPSSCHPDSRLDGDSTTRSAMSVMSRYCIWLSERLSNKNMVESYRLYYHRRRRRYVWYARQGLLQLFLAALYAMSLVLSHLSADATPVNAFLETFSLCLLITSTLCSRHSH